MKDPWSPTSWRKKPITQQVVYQDRDALEEVLGQSGQTPAAGHELGSGNAQEPVGRGRSRRAFPLAGRRLCRELPRLPFRADRQQAEDPAEDEHHSRLRHASSKSSAWGGLPASTPSRGRPTRKPATASPCPAYRGDLINRSGFTLEDRTPDPDAAAARLRASRLDAQLHPQPGPGRLCRLPPSRLVGPGLRQPRRPIGRLSRHHGRHRRLDPVHGDHCRPVADGIESRRLLHQPRGAAPRLRAGPNATGAAPHRLVQPEHAFALDRRSHPRRWTGPTSSTSAASPTRSA